MGRCHPEVYGDDVGTKLWDWLEGEVKAFEASGTASWDVLRVGATFVSIIPWDWSDQPSGRDV